MSIELPNGKELSAVLQGVKSSASNVAEVAEAHRTIWRGVMSRWPHQAECALASQCCARRFNGSAGRLLRVHCDVGMKWSVQIEIISRVKDLFDMLARMRAQQLLISRARWLAPFPVGMPLF